ncbi:galectin-1-like [Lissotriton helveticus]
MEDQKTKIQPEQQSNEKQGTPALVTSTLGLKPGTTLIIDGIVHPKTDRFNISIGQDLNSLALQFDACFNFGGNINTIVLNSRYHGVWGEEIRHYDFPFHLGQKMGLTIRYTMDEMQITLKDNVKIPFPNRLNLDVVNSLFVDGFNLNSYSVVKTHVKES